MKVICDWKDCKEIGAYKAPIERDNSKKFRLLCLNHIKIFNKNWNYFENMNDQEIEFFIKSDLTWHKSTKNFGSSENFFISPWKSNFFFFDSPLPFENSCWTCFRLIDSTDFEKTL